MAFLGRYYPLYNLATHSMDKTVQAFKPETGKEKDDKGERIHKVSKHIYSGRVEFSGIISIVMSHVGIL